MAFINYTVKLIPILLVLPLLSLKETCCCEEWWGKAVSYKQHNIYMYLKYECQETSVYGCIAAVYLKVVIYESNICVEKIYKGSSMWVVNKERNKYKCLLFGFCWKNGICTFWALSKSLWCWVVCEPEIVLQCRVLRLSLVGGVVDEGGSGGCTFCSGERSWAQCSACPAEASRGISLGLWSCSEMNFWFGKKALLGSPECS